MTAANISIGDVPALLGPSVHTLSQKVLAENQSFNVAISGGSLPKLLAAGLPDTTDFSKWNVYLADERIVPLDDKDSNYREVISKFPGMSVVPINPELSPEDCANDYESKVQAMGGVFDLVLLGLGPDGHTCSLFPGHPLLNEVDRDVAYIKDSPKPPPNRVTLTLPILNKANAVMFVCTGDGKKEVVKDILENPDSKLPGALVRPETRLDWYLDQAAASLISQ